jgi:hypothetical protein
MLLWPHPSVRVTQMQPSARGEKGRMLGERACPLSRERRRTFRSRLGRFKPMADSIPSLAPLRPAPPQCEPLHAPDHLEQRVWVKFEGQLRRTWRITGAPKLELAPEQGSMAGEAHAATTRRSPPLPPRRRMRIPARGPLRPRLPRPWLALHPRYARGSLRRRLSLSPAQPLLARPRRGSCWSHRRAGRRNRTGAMGAHRHHATVGAYGDRDGLHLRCLGSPGVRHRTHPRGAARMEVENHLLTMESVV